MATNEDAFVLAGPSGACLWSQLFRGGDRRIAEKFKDRVAYRRRLISVHLKIFKFS